MKALSFLSRHLLFLLLTVVLPVTCTATGGALVFCTKVGCVSGVTFIAHLDVPPDALIAHGSFRACHRNECWDGTFAAPTDGQLVDASCFVESSLAIERRCSLEKEGLGSRLRIGVTLSQTTSRGRTLLLDGDRVSLRVELAGRAAPLVDHVRYVTYEDHYPNGRVCGSGCSVAGVEIWPGAKSGVSCASAVCDPDVRIETELHATREGAGGTRLSVCKNGDCHTTAIQSLWDWDEAKGEPIPRANLGSASLGTVDGSRASVSALSASQPSGEPYAVTFDFRGDPRGYKSGDTYAVEWRSRSGKVLLSERKFVASYDESHPGGPACSPVACRTKTLDD